MSPRRSKKTARHIQIGPMNASRLNALTYVYYPREYTTYIHDISNSALDKITIVFTKIFIDVSLHLVVAERSPLWFGNLQKYLPKLALRGAEIQRRMIMGIDHPWHDRSTLGVDYFGAFSANLSPSHRNNPVVEDHNVYAINRRCPGTIDQAGIGDD